MFYFRPEIEDSTLAQIPRLGMDSPEYNLDILILLQDNPWLRLCCRTVIMFSHHLAPCPFSLENKGNMTTCLWKACDLPVCGHSCSSPTRLQVHSSTYWALFMADSRQSAKNSFYTLDGSRCPLTEPMIKDSERLQVPLATWDYRCCGPIQTAGGALAAICSRPTFGHGSLAVTVESTGSAWRSDCLCLQMRSGNLKLEQLSVLSDGFQQGPRFGQWPPAGAAGVRPLDTKMN